MNSGKVPTRYSVVEIPTNKLDQTVVGDDTVCLVDPHRQWTWWGTILENVFLWRIPKYCIVYWGNGNILSDAFYPGWEPINLLSLSGAHRNLHVRRRSRR